MLQKKMTFSDVLSEETSEKNAFFMRMDAKGTNQSIYRIIKARNPNSGVNQNSGTFSIPTRTARHEKSAALSFRFFADKKKKNFS